MDSVGGRLGRPYRLSLFLAGASVLLTLISGSIDVVREILPGPDGPALTTLHDLFEVRGEQTVQSWFSVLILAAAAALAIVLGSRLRSAGSRMAWRWWGIGGALLFASMDEGVSIHELVDNPDAPAGATRYAWLLPAIPIVIALALWAFPAIRALPSMIGAMVLASGVIFVTGAAVMEFVGGFFYGTDLVYGGMAHIEETLEMLGVVLFIEAMLRVLQVPRDESGRIVWRSATPLVGARR